MGEKCKLLVGKLEGRRPLGLGRPRYRGVDNIKVEEWLDRYIFNKYVMECG
jgi:hypothetical protein